MRVSFIVVSYRRPRQLLRCLESLDIQEVDDAEVLVVLNGRDAGDARLLQALARQQPHARIITLSRRVSRGAARNLALKRAGGEVLYFLDDDVTVPPGFAGRVREKFLLHPEASCIGGPNLAAPGATPFQEAVDFLLRSPWGAGPMRVRYVADAGDRLLPGWAFMLCNMGVRRAILGGPEPVFSERCVSAEENLLLHRLELAGHRALYSRDLRVLHMRRARLSDFCRQVFQSGQGRMQITRMAPRSLQWAVALPPLFVAYLGAWALGPWNLWLAAPLLAFAAVCAFESLRLFREKRSSAVWLPVLLPAAYGSYALGLLAGLFLPLDRLPAGAAGAEGLAPETEAAL